LSYDPLYIRHLYHFNRDRDYFECHEVLEELWLREGRSLLYQGLLQVAVGLYHHRNGNLNGASKLLTGALQKLAAYPPDVLGIDLGKLRDDSAAYLIGVEEALRTGEPERFPFRELTIDILDPALAEAVERLAQEPPSEHGRE
jgi:predicted metal-dependent hydrolase